jgi:hypothetical protein
LGGALVENTLVIGEFAGTGNDPASLHDVVPRIIDSSPDVERVSCFRRLDGPEGCDHWILVELRAAASAAAVTRVLADAGGRSQGYHEVFRMVRTESGTPRHVPLSTALDTTPDHILTVILPVPLGRAAEWDRWYDEEHMPTVFRIAPAIRVGHRFAPVTEPTTGEFLVMYEFPSRQSLDQWQRGTTVAAKRDEYARRWGVRNTRRAFTVEFRRESTGAPA